MSAARVRASVDKALLQSFWGVTVELTMPSELLQRHANWTILRSWRGR